ncbi:hypothetical protein AJ80_03294 [Polytolypa hystricis UAMH7299]|uniref:Uncharacterized protein n=1 Tax=Polytolypa hystricis (strain UAMH7299) TaxID=1447883 RepID=A0A2B7YL97_POLH7|nr:hypothetical protein AJ80_03294 [Polytolypa hystricis UAMH7299]
MFRIIPNNKTIEPLLEEYAKALKNMLLLEEAESFTRLSWWPNDDMEDDYPDRDLGQRRLATEQEVTAVLPRYGES